MAENPNGSTDYEVVARNFSTSSENRIHSDEIARKYGFTGALVPGVAVYGHLTYPLVQARGEAWLAGSRDSLRLLKPAYHGDRLHVTLQPQGQGERAGCYNNQGTLLATVDSFPAAVPDPDETRWARQASLLDEYKEPGRVDISWERIKLQQRFAPWQYTISAAENQRYVTEISDPLPVYSTYAHPHLLCSLANTALTNEYFMPAWIHVGTETRRHQALRVGDTISVQAAPVDKWRKKGHEFVQLYITYQRNGDLTTELLHTAIYKVAA